MSDTSHETVPVVPPSRGDHVQAFVSGGALAKTWLRLVAGVGLAQAGVQILGLICGIFIVRTLPAGEYALYTLANTMLGTLAILADGGITTGAMARGGRVWRNRVSLGSVVSTGLSLRRRFAFASCGVGIPILIYLLRQHGASWSEVFALSIAIVLSFGAALSASILNIAPMLHQRIQSLQIISLGLNLGRLGLLYAALSWRPIAALGIAASGIMQIWANARLRKLTREVADYPAKEDPDARREIIKTVRAILPSAVYYCVSGQLTIWLVSVFGTTNTLADVGALGRLAQALALLSAVISTLMIPRFARLDAAPRLLLAIYVSALAALVAVSGVVIGLASTYPEAALKLLGSTYSDLAPFVALSVASGCVNMLAGAAFGLAAARGWIVPPALSITAGVASQILLCFTLDVGTVQGVLWFTVLGTCVQLVLNVARVFVVCLRGASVS